MDTHDEGRRRLVAQALQAPGIDPGGLWFAYLGLGGTLGRHELQAHLDGHVPLPPPEEDRLAEAARELLEARRPLPATARGDDTGPPSPTDAAATPE